MATDVVPRPDRPAMTEADLVAFTKKELDADADRQAKLQATSLGEVPRESQTGATLDLSHKNIHALPVEVITLIKDKVERLALSHNPQIAVPSQIVQCDRLRYLNIRWNQLKQFPEAVLQLHKLEILDISKNRIATIPEDIKKMTSLKFLAIARNRITRLPLTLGEMNTLTKLKFDENPIEFPPPDALRPSPERMSFAGEAEKEKDMCLQVKRFMRAEAMKARLKATAEDDLSESNADTPRPPKRTVTGGRFPIRPSISGIENIVDFNSESPETLVAPPIPQRSHARGLSNASLSVAKRPTVAPLLTGADDTNRNRSETVSSTASIRQRRQGFVPIRKPTREMELANEAANQRSSQASTIKPMHSRAPSSASTINSFLTTDNSQTSSSATSPVDGAVSHFGISRRLSSLPENRSSKSPANHIVKVSHRLVFTLQRLRRPISDVAGAVRDGMPQKSILEYQLLKTGMQLDELDRCVSKVGRYDAHIEASVVRSIVTTSTSTLKIYAAMVAELKRGSRILIRAADAIYLRCLLFEVHSAIVEVRNLCVMLGFKVRESASKITPRTTSAAWSSRNATPTQPKSVYSKRMRGATILQSMTSNATLRTMPLPPVPVNTGRSRTNTATPMGSATPRSAESFSLATLPRLSRTNTMQSITDDSDVEQQFDKIFLKLKAACDLAGGSLPSCRKEIFDRRENARNAGQNRLGEQWDLALNRCEHVISSNSLLAKRLKGLMVNDPAVRSQKEFWQLCDNFVHEKTWTDLATLIKDLGQQRVEVTAIKSVMRNVQKAVKDVSKTISHSPLYHQSLGTRPPAADSSLPQPLATPYSTGFNQAYLHGLNNINTHIGGNGYTTPVPATPLSAALGPAAQATIASKSNGVHLPREYLQQPPLTSRAIHERNDTVMQSTGQPRRQ